MDRGRGRRSDRDSAYRCMNRLRAVVPILEGQQQLVGEMVQCRGMLVDALEMDVDELQEGLEQLESFGLLREEEEKEEKEEEEEGGEGGEAACRRPPWQNLTPPNRSHFEFADAQIQCVPSGFSYFFIFVSKTDKL